MRTDGATDRTRMKDGFNSVFHPCSISGLGSIRTLPARRDPNLRTKHPKDRFLCPSYCGPTAVLLSFYCRPTAVLLSFYCRPGRRNGHKQGEYSNVRKREENISVKYAKTSTSRDTYYRLLTLMTVTPPQVRKSVEKCRILWNRRTSPERRCNVKRDGPRSDFDGRRTGVR